MAISTTTLRISEDKLKLIRAIAGYENRPLSEIFSELAEEYIERNRETFELLNIPGFANECKKGLTEIKNGGGKTLNELDD